MTENADSTLMLHLGFELVSSMYVPWSECGWIGDPQPTEGAAREAGLAHMRDCKEQGFAP